MPSATDSIFLWGAPGVGKTTIGRRLARAMHRPFIDTDALVVERTGMPIVEIFAKFGEPAFRALETEALTLACQTPGAVVALGGGTPLAAHNRALISQHGRSIHLRASIATLEGRLQRQRVGRRPLLVGVSVGRLVEARLPLYESADHGIDIEGQTLNDVVAAIRRLL